MIQNSHPIFIFISILVLHHVSNANVVSQNIEKQPVIARAVSFSTLPALLHISVPKKNNNKGKKDDPAEYHLILFPIANRNININNFNSIQAINPVAGSPFSVFAAIVDEHNDIQDVDGEFQFHWSAHNYVNPSKPKNRAKLIESGHRYTIQNGVAVIANVRYDEAGSIKLTGMARIQIPNEKANHEKANHKKEDQKKTKVIIKDSRPFVVTLYDFQVSVLGNQTQFTAGEAFTLRITPINAFGNSVENFAQDNGNTNRTLQIYTRVVSPDGARNGSLYNAQGSIVVSVSYQAFRDGSATVSDLRFSEAGVLEMQIVDSDYLGTSIQGQFHRIGTFLPHHVKLEVVEQTVSGGDDAQYNYYGQTHHSTITVTAESSFSPPTRTYNYYGDMVSVSRDALRMSLPSAQSQIGSVSFTYSQTGFQSGMNILYTTQQLQVRESQNPNTIALHYTFEDINKREGSFVSPGLEYRSGRIRIRGNQGIAGGYLEVRSEMEYFMDSIWQRNSDEDKLTISPADLSFSDNPQHIRISGDTRNFFAGYIRGGSTPYQIHSARLPNSMRFTIGLQRRSHLSFLRVVSEPWHIYTSSTSHHVSRIVSQKVTP